ncbi:MAG: DNA repair protein RecN [Gemmatimonadetes bacterium]|nr:MAG: DNA repair protein RecN [Gemmatimonadota bacterium]
MARRGAVVVRRPGRHHDPAGRASTGAARRAPRAPHPTRPGRLLRAHAQEAPVGRPLRPGAEVVLTELRVRDLAVIADVTLPLQPGFNVLTGETGAGKSMLVDALALLLGERASSDVVRPGATKAVVEGVFELTPAALDRLLPSLTALGVEGSDGVLVVKREVHGEGKSRAWVNGSPTTVGVLAQLGALLVDLHGQHETQSLLRADAQRDILDAYAAATVEAVAVRDAGERLRALERRETDLHDRQEEVRRKADYLRHVVEEITRAAPKPGEDAALDIEAKRLTHADELGRLSKEMEQTLEAAGFARAGKLLGSLQRLDASVAKWRELLDAIFANVAELTTAVRDYAAEIEADPGRLAAVEQRRDLLYRLQQKYGPSLPDVLATRDASAKELELLDTADLDLRSLAEERATTAREFERACAALTAKRQTGARHLEQAVRELLPALGMPEGRFAVRIIPRTTHPAQGAEAIVFEIQLNVGLDPRPLARVASGGELSRLMLALKVVLASHDAVPTLVFDEVDQGIGGEVGARVGEALAAVASRPGRQVLVITHLPQIAASADHQLVVAKGAKGGVATSDVQVVSGEPRTRELARMLGDPDMATAVRHAEELLKRASGIPASPGGTPSPPARRSPAR